MKKIALITGVNGQDGTYLAEFLLAKNYQVIGLCKKKKENDNFLKGKIEYAQGNLNEPDGLCKLITHYKPHEIYNLASQSYPGQSWDLALETAETNGISAHRLFDLVKRHKPDCRIYQASSSEMFGQITQTPQNENTPFCPTNPYAAAKLYAHHIAKIYRKSYNLFISCGILFNHESPRRGMHFITQKVTYAAACLKKGIKNSELLNEKGEPIVKDGFLYLGNLDAKRDWGFAGDYVEAMWLMLQHHQPEDFIIGTGEIRTIRQLCETAFSYVDLDWNDHVKIDQRLVRPIETGPTVADPLKAKKVLGWKPKTSFKELIALMVDNHLKNLSVRAVPAKST